MHSAVRNTAPNDQRKSKRPSAVRFCHAKKNSKKRHILPDPRFNDVVVTKFVNNMMQDGKKAVAYEIFYDAIDRVSERTGEEGLELWKKALHNVTPAVEVKSRRVGCLLYTSPSPRDRG